MKKEVLLSIRNLEKYFAVKKMKLFQKEKELVKANDDVNIDIIKNETLGIVGESGCGKSTLGRTIIHLQEPTNGTTLYYGETINDFLPEYVKEIYQNLPQFFKIYKEDVKKLISGNDQYIKRIKLEEIGVNKEFQNTLRLLGGLLLSGDLKSLRLKLNHKYLKLKKRNVLNKKLILSEKKNTSQEMVDKIKKKMKDLEFDIKFIDKDLRKLRKKTSKHKDFLLYDSFLDDGIDLTSLKEHEKRTLRRNLQIIFQDPCSSLDTRSTVGDLIGEGLIIHKIFKNKRSKGYEEYIIDMMEKCGLDKDYINRYPHQFSGGQRQRIGIARALALKPKFVVCDEAVSALDVSIQSQIINLLQELKESNNLTYLFITHDLGVAKYISDRIAVMYFGNIVELAPAHKIFENPLHPYTKELLNAIPKVDDEEVDNKIWNISYETSDYSFKYHVTGKRDVDWVEIEKGHYIACELRNKEKNDERK